MCCCLFLDSFSFPGKRTVAERITQGNKFGLVRKQFLACNLDLSSSEAAFWMECIKLGDFSKS